MATTAAPRGSWARSPTWPHAFDMLVVAEGVETEEQLGMIRALSCDYAQGFYFSEAVDAAAIEEICSGEPSWQRATLSAAPT